MAEVSTRSLSLSVSSPTAASGDLDASTDLVAVVAVVTAAAAETTLHLVSALLALSGVGATGIALVATSTAIGVLSGARSVCRMSLIRHCLDGDRANPASTEGCAAGTGEHADDSTGCGIAALTKDTGSAFSRAAMALVMVSGLNPSSPAED